MKKYLVLFIVVLGLLTMGDLAFASDPVGVMKGYDATTQTYVPIAVSASGTLPATYPDRYSNKPVGTALGWCDSLGKYLPIPVASNGGIILSENLGASSLADLDDVEITDATNSQYITYDGATEKWVNTTAAAGTAFPLPDLTDVTISSIADDQILRYDAGSSHWVNEDLPSSGGADTATITAAIDANIASITALQNDVANAWIEIYANTASITQNITDILSNRTDIDINIASITALEASPNEWTASGSTQIYTEKSVGIGTSTPDVDNSIDVYSKDGTGHFWLGNSSFGWKSTKNGYSYFNSSSNGITSLYVLQAHSIYNESYVDPTYHNSGMVTTSHLIRFYTDNIETMRLTENQNLCIGTTVDDGVNKVQINGDVKIDGKLTLPHNKAINNTYNDVLKFTHYYTYFYDKVVPYAGISMKYAGTESTPYYTWLNDPNTGFFNPSADTLGLTTGGTAGLTINKIQMVEVPHYIRMANSMAMIDMTENTTGQVIPVSTDWTELTFTNGDDHYAVGDCIASSTNNCIQILATGVYDIRVESSFYCNDRSTQWKFNALVDGESSHAGFVRYTANSNDVGCAMGSGIVVVATAPAIITVGVQHNESSTSTLTCYRTALIVKYLGEIQ